MKKVIIISVVALVIIGIVLGIYFFFFAPKDLFELKAEDITSITIPKDGADEAVVFDSKEDIEWLVSKLNSVKYKREDIAHSVIKPDDTSYSITIEGKGGYQSYRLAKHLVRSDKSMYHLTDGSKEIIKEIFAKIGK